MPKLDANNVMLYVIQGELQNTYSGFCYAKTWKKKIEGGV